MKKKILLTILIGLILLIVLPSIYLGYRAITIQQATSKLFKTDNCGAQDLILWYSNLGIEYNSDNYDFNDIKIYKESLTNFPSFANFLLPNISAYQSPLQVFAVKDFGVNLPLDVTIQAKFTAAQYDKNQTVDLNWGDKYLICNIELPKEDTTETINISGKLAKDDVLNLIRGRYEFLLNNLNTDPNSLPLFFPADIYTQTPNYLILGQDIFKKLEISEYILPADQARLFLNDNKYYLGEIVLKDDNFSRSIDVIFSLMEEEYQFDLSQVNLVLLDYLKEKGITLKLDCSDCLLAPVSKQFSLKSSYAPAVSGINWSGGGNLTTNAKANLMEMLNDAKSEGISTTIISAYRSYNDQVATFNYWVGKEMANGLTRAQAEIKANNYSAYPGQSEHQLGNTVDIKCSSCGSFDNSTGNLTLYKFLKENAHKYGFAISYPDGKKNLTGYNSEPWHIRYIGVEAATKLFEKEYLENNDMYLTKFLVEYNYY